jgi:hypothetical protein
MDNSDRTAEQMVTNLIHTRPLCRRHCFPRLRSFGPVKGYLLSCQNSFWNDPGQGTFHQETPLTQANELFPRYRMSEGPQIAIKKGITVLLEKFRIERP